MGQDTVEVRMSPEERMQKALQLTEVMGKVKALQGQKSNLSRSIKGLTETQDKLREEVNSGVKAVNQQDYQMALNLSDQPSAMDRLKSAWEIAAPAEDFLDDRAEENGDDDGEAE